MDSTSTRSTTAEGAAFCRALGALERDQRLRNPDHLAHHFVTRWGWRMGLLPGLRMLARRSVEQRLPGALVLHQVRARLFDELVLKAARDGVAQLVILGAGGDSRAYRFHSHCPGLRVFEVDHPETSRWKQARVRRMLGHLPEYVRCVPVRFDSEAVAPALESAGFDFKLRTSFLWEGVTMYLRPDAFDAILALVATAARGSEIAFDYLYADAVAHPARFDGAIAHTNYVASRNEPFLFGLDPVVDRLSDYLAARAFVLVENWDHVRLRTVYAGSGHLMPYVGIVQARVAAISVGTGSRASP
jgi:methyltransferase (TIGR00027 family)